MCAEGRGARACSSHRPRRVEVRGHPGSVHRVGGWVAMARGYVGSGGARRLRRVNRWSPAHPVPAPAYKPAPNYTMSYTYASIYYSLSLSL